MTTFESLTVGEYQALLKVQLSEMDEMDKITESVAILTGKSNAQIEDMPMTEFNSISAEIVKIFEQAKLEADPKRTIKVNGRTYGITYEPKHLRTAQYIEIQHFMKGNIIENLHLLMASISYPVKRAWWGGMVGSKNDSTRHEIVAEDMKDARFVDVYSAAIFFCHLLKNSIKGLEVYLIRELKMKGVMPSQSKKILMDLQSSLDGFIPPLKLRSMKGLHSMPVMN